MLPLQPWGRTCRSSRPAAGRRVPESGRSRSSPAETCPCACGHTRRRCRPSRRGCAACGGGTRRPVTGCGKAERRPGQGQAAGGGVLAQGRWGGRRRPTGPPRRLGRPTACTRPPGWGGAGRGRPDSSGHAQRTVLLSSALAFGLNLAPEVALPRPPLPASPRPSAAAASSAAVLGGVASLASVLHGCPRWASAAPVAFAEAAAGEV